MSSEKKIPFSFSFSIEKIIFDSEIDENLLHVPLVNINVESKIDFGGINSIFGRSFLGNLCFEIKVTTAMSIAFYQAFSEFRF